LWVSNRPASATEKKMKRGNIKLNDRKSTPATYTTSYTTYSKWAAQHHVVPANNNQTPDENILIQHAV
jgi:hypothetical protein